MEAGGKRLIWRCDDGTFKVSAKLAAAKKDDSGGGER